MLKRLRRAAAGAAGDDDHAEPEGEPIPWYLRVLARCVVLAALAAVFYVVSSLTPPPAPPLHARRAGPATTTWRRRRAARTPRTSWTVLVLVGLVLAGSALATRWRGAAPAVRHAPRGPRRGARQRRGRRCWWPPSTPPRRSSHRARRPAGRGAGGVRGDGRSAVRRPGPARPRSPPVRHRHRAARPVRSRPGWSHGAPARDADRAVPRGPVQRAPDGRGRPRQRPRLPGRRSAASWRPAVADPVWRPEPTDEGRGREHAGRAGRRGRGWCVVAVAPRLRGGRAAGGAVAAWPWWPRRSPCSGCPARRRPGDQRPAGPPVENAPFRSYRQVAEALSWASVSPRHYDLVTRPLLVRLLASRLADRHGSTWPPTRRPPAALVGDDIWHWLDPDREVARHGPAARGRPRHPDPHRRPTGDSVSASDRPARP